MSEVHCVYATVSNPSSAADPGRVTEGFYTVADGVVTMTNPEGVPIRDIEGDRITHKLADGENAKAVASRLTMKIFRAVRGDDVGGFNRPTSSIKYEKWVI
jgi:hypothetical protein